MVVQFPSHACNERAGCDFSQDGAPRAKTWLECFGCPLMDPWRHKVSNVHTTTPPYPPSAGLGMYAPMLEAWLQWWPEGQLQVMNYQELVDRPFELVNSVLARLGALHSTFVVAQRAHACRCASRSMDSVRALAPRPWRTRRPADACWRFARMFAQ
jgi:hypothetical protein